MNTTQPTSLEISEVKDTENYNKDYTPILSLALLELSYDHVKQKYIELIVRKAKRLKQLENIDLLSVDEIKAESIVWQIKNLTLELDLLYGFKLFVDLLSKSYYESLEEQNISYQRHIDLLEYDNIRLQQIYDGTCESLSLMTDLAIKQSEAIISLKQKSNQ